MDPGDEELTKAGTQGGAETSAFGGPGGPVFSYPVSFHRVDLYTHASTTVTGTVTVQIRNADGSAVIGTTTVSGSSLLKGNSVKNSFYFYPTLTLNSGEKYRIYLTRSNTHNHMNDFVYWRSSSGNTNPYPQGNMNYPAWNADYAFITYSGGYTDQKQLSTNYGFAVGNNSWLWQEFVPQYIWVIGQ
jgi:hypothetical protein